MTGKILWKERGPGKKSASVTAAGGRLVLRWADGTVALAKASPDGFTVTGSFKIPGSGDRASWSHSVIVGGNSVSIWANS